MAHPERRIYSVLLFLTSASGLGWFINSYPPTSPALFLWFYPICFFMLFFLAYALTLHSRRSLLLALGLIVILFLRGMHLRHPLYPVLLILLLVSLEHAFSSIRKSR